MTTTINASTSAGLIQTADTSGILQLQTAGTAAVTVDASQLVGVGTTSPTTVFHTAGANGTYATTLAESVTYAKLRFQNSTVSSLSLFQGVSNSSNANWYFQIANGPGTGAYDISLNPFGGNVGIGTTSPARPLDVRGASGMQINEDGAGTKVISIRSNFASLGPAINVTTNDPLLFLNNGTERMRINAGAPILCLAGGSTTATGTGIAFPATQSASSDVNTLDDYEEGTFTPFIYGTTTAGVGTYTTQQGAYTKIGNVVNFKTYVNWTAHTGTGAMVMGGLPFTSKNDGFDSSVCIGYISGITLPASNYALAYLAPNGTYVVIVGYVVGGPTSSSISMDAAGGVEIGGSYFTAT